jgi:Spy/CpxP family protein refolding chaperone
MTRIMSAAVALSVLSAGATLAQTAPTTSATQPSWVDPDKRGKLYRDEGWTSFDERAKPYSDEEIAHQRNLTRQKMPV